MPVVVPNGASSSAPGPSYTPAHAAAVERVRRAKGNPYIILDVPINTIDHAVLKTAKRKGALSLHPDKNRHPGAAEAMKQFNEAFEILISLPPGRVWAPPAAHSQPAPAQPKPKPKPAAAPSQSYQDPYQRFREYQQQQEKQQEQQRQRQQQEQQRQRQQKPRFTGADPRFRNQQNSPKSTSSQMPYAQFFSSARSHTAPGPGPQRPYSTHDYFTNSGPFGQGRSGASSSSGPGFRQHPYEPSLDEDDDDEEEDIECTGFRSGTEDKSKTNAQPPCDHCHRISPLGVWPHPILAHLRLCRECTQLPQFQTITKEQAITQLGLTEEDLRLFADNIPADKPPVAAWKRNAFLRNQPLTRVYLREHLLRVRRTKQEAQQEKADQSRQRQQQSDQRKKGKATRPAETEAPSRPETERERMMREAEARAALLGRAQQAEERRRATAEAEMEERRRLAAEAEMAARIKQEHSARAKTEHRQRSPSTPVGDRSAADKDEEDASETESKLFAEEMKESIRRHREAAEAERARKPKREPQTSQSASAYQYRPTGSSSSQHASTSTEQVRADKAKTRSQRAWDELDDILEAEILRQQRRAQGRETSEDSADERIQAEAKRRLQEEAEAQAKARDEARKMDLGQRQHAAFAKMREDIKAQRAAHVAAAEAAEAADPLAGVSSSKRPKGNGQYRTPYVVSDDSDQEVEMREVDPNRSSSSAPSSNPTTSHSSAGSQVPMPGSFHPGMFADVFKASPSNPGFQKNADRPTSVVTISDSDEEYQIVGEKRSNNGKERMQEDYRAELPTDEDADGDDGSFTTARDAANQGDPLGDETESEIDELDDDINDDPISGISSGANGSGPSRGAAQHQQPENVQNADGGMDDDVAMGSASTSRISSNDGRMPMPFPFMAAPGPATGHPSGSEADERVRWHAVDKEQVSSNPAPSQQLPSVHDQRNRRRSTLTEAFLAEMASPAKKVRMDPGPSIPGPSMPTPATDSPFAAFNPSSSSKSSGYRQYLDSDLDDGETEASNAWFQSSVAQSGGGRAPTTVHSDRSKAKITPATRERRAGKKKQQQQEGAGEASNATGMFAQAGQNHSHSGMSSAEPVERMQAEASTSERLPSFPSNPADPDTPTANRTTRAPPDQTLTPSKRQKPNPSPSPAPAPASTSNPTRTARTPSKRITRFQIRKKEAAAQAAAVAKSAPVLPTVAEENSALPFRSLHIAPDAKGDGPMLESELAQGLRIDPRPPMFRPPSSAKPSSSAGPSSSPFPSSSSATPKRAPVTINRANGGIERRPRLPVHHSGNVVPPTPSMAALPFWAPLGSSRPAPARPSVVNPSEIGVVDVEMTDA
ncbi:unnamed protein product [Tilletia controversa]|nr:unnamed protein product [Tilletia controversa]